MEVGRPVRVLSDPRSLVTAGRVAAGGGMNEPVGDTRAASPVRERAALGRLMRAGSSRKGRAGPGAAPPSRHSSARAWPGRIGRSGGVASGRRGGPRPYHFPPCLAHRPATVYGAAKAVASLRAEDTDRRGPAGPGSTDPLCCGGGAGWGRAAGRWAGRCCATRAGPTRPPPMGWGRGSGPPLC